MHSIHSELLSVKAMPDAPHSSKCTGTTYGGNIPNSLTT
jgi:hypothetical protein